MEKEVKVSVMCMAYNHANYIRDALEGFVSQKTDFAFEIIIHDDASTDGTADIIREYERKYPKPTGIGRLYRWIDRGCGQSAVHQVGGLGTGICCQSGRMCLSGAAIGRGDYKPEQFYYSGKEPSYR